MYPSVDGRLDILAVLPLSFAVIIALRRFIANRESKPCLPPGPVPLPLIGNVLSIDAKEPWLTYTKWHAAYGQGVISINSQHIAEALLDKRSDIYSDRPYLATAEQFSSSVGMSTIYDYEPSARNDPLVRIMENTVAVGLQMTTPGKAILLQLFPFLLKLPDWCWGSSIKRDAQISTDHMNKIRDLPFQSAQQHMAENSFLGQFSMVAENLQRMEKQDEASKPTFEVALKRAAVAGVMGSYETTSSTLMVFALAMVLYPDVQRRAQAEIDSVIGRDRLPTFEDRASLPYVESILRETFRWHPILPLGVPHATSSDDTYDGFFIPKGTTVMCNTWAISRDEKRYPDASRFMPERFLDVNGVLTNDDPARYVFGLGRRACPGRHAGDASVWSAIVTMLATVDFSFAKDDQGKVIDFTPQFNPGLVW
ncbi:cytochrome P450 [Suillus subaureus]|uniref:Cytochrome P450 n=1 Tax=Suillus subaureus TaxID=48587 RepID=A0A9P7EIG6_9AGAM|nr:cytochrome P450 [Suillus subaureus]KAG1822453.1 cytochrome P450 [Suillus subaureus]